MKCTLSCADAPLKDTPVITGVYFSVLHFACNVSQVFDGLEQKNPLPRFNLMLWVFQK